MNKNQKLKI